MMADLFASFFLIKNSLLCSVAATADTYIVMHLDCTTNIVHVMVDMGKHIAFIVDPNLVSRR